MKSDSKWKIGVDLDNTIISYDEVLHKLSVEKGLIDLDTISTKKIIRDVIRRLHDGEILWQKLQAEVYGPRINEARLIEGVAEFFTECAERSIGVYIISHKTEFANYDETGINLRTAAIDWLEGRGFFGNDGFCLSRDQVFFESTRRAKIQRIVNLGCTHFIDDLEETFLEEFFPTDVVKILFDPHALYKPRQGCKIYSSWSEIKSALFSQKDG